MMQRHGNSVRQLGKQYRLATLQKAETVDNRTRRFKLSDSSVALDGHTLATSGWDLSRAKENLPVLWAHNAEDASCFLGQWRNIHVEGDSLVGDAAFMTGDVNPLAETCLQMIDGGWLRAASVGFVPLEGKPSKRGPGTFDFTAQLLLEASIVPVGSLDSALVSARSAGVDLRPLAAWALRSIDKGTSKMPVAELEAIRRAASGALPKVYPMARQHGGAFQSFGEQMTAVARSRVTGETDPRLVRAPAGNNEVDPSGGGFLVGQQFVEKLVGSIYEEAVIAPLCSRIETDGPLASVKIPAVDETSRADGSRWGGAASFWASEAAGVSSVYPRFRQIEFSAKKLISVVYASSELYDDVAMLEAHLTRALASEFAFKLDQSILAGTGTGQPLGVLNSSALISVAKANGQAAATIVKENLNGMWSRLPAPSRRNAVWLMSEDAMAQIDAGASNYQGVYAEPENGERFPRLKGAPVYEIEQASALGAVGDILLADLSQYQLVGSEMKTAISADTRFVNDEIVFRFTMRVDGAPLWASPITPFNGTSTRSPFVALAAR